MRGPRSLKDSSQDGFTLVEMSIALVLLMLGLLLAAQILMETSQLFTETSGEAQDTPVPLVIARIRGDVQGAASASPIVLDDGTLALALVGGPEDKLIYQKRGNDLLRRVVPTMGAEPAPTILWHNVSAWSFQVVPGTGLVDLQVTYRRRTVPHTPLAVMPAYRGPLTEELTQRLYLLPRGGGLGDTW